MYTELRKLWNRLIELLEAGASIYDEEVDTLIDAIEDQLVKLDKRKKAWYNSCTGVQGNGNK